MTNVTLARAVPQFQLFKRSMRALFLFVSLAFAAQALAGPTVAIFLSDTGNGHKKEAEALRAKILEKYPDATVILKNIWDFAYFSSDEQKNKGIEEKASDNVTDLAGDQANGKSEVPPGRVQSLKNWIWGTVLRNFPTLRDRGYKSAMRAGIESETLEDVATYHRAFNKAAAYEWLAKVRPNTVFATNYSGVEILRVLRQKEVLQDVNVGWIVTDYTPGYWPKVSKFLDLTVLPHPAMRPIWESFGVSSEQISDTGMLLDPEILTPIDRDRFFGASNEMFEAEGLERPNLSSDAKTIVLTGGSDGAAPFTSIVKELAAGTTSPLQIVAICGKNENEFKSLQELRKTLPKNVKVVPTRFIKPGFLLNLVKASDLYVTKAGGLSPTEGFVIGKPMVVYLSPGGGVEIGNVDFFAQQGLAETVNSPKEIGPAVVDLITNKGKLAKIDAAQKLLRDSMTSDPVVDFAALPRPSQRENVPYKDALPAAVSPRGPPPRNAGKVLVDKKDGMWAKILLFRSAISNIDFNAYIFRMDEVGMVHLSELRRAARRGVNVRAILDGGGARKITRGMRRHLINEGMKIRVYRPRRPLTEPHLLIHRMHDKYASADGVRALVCGNNAQNSYYGIDEENNRVNFDDLGFYFEGQNVASGDKYFDERYNSDEVEEWNEDVPAKEVLEAEALLNQYDDAKIKELFGEPDRTLLTDLHPMGGFRVVSDPNGVIDTTEGVWRDIEALVRKAQKGEVVTIVTPYFVLTDEMRATLQDGVAKGVIFLIYTNSRSSNDNPFVQAGYKRELDDFRAMGLNIFEYQGNMLHAKAAWRSVGHEIKEAYIGSFNWDAFSQKHNTEVGVVFEPDNSPGNGLVRELKLFVANVENQSVPVTGPNAMEVPRTWNQCILDLLARPLVQSKFVRDHL